MRALIFSLSYFPHVGGAEVAVKEITDRISSSEIEFDMVTLRLDKRDKRFERVGNVNVYRIGGGLGYLSKILFIPQAAAFAFGRRYDLWWAMMTYMLFPISLLRILGSKTKYVLTLQDGDPFAHVFDRMRISIFKPLLISGFKNAHKIQAISNFLADWAQTMGYKGRVEVIPNGVDLAKFSSLENEEKNSGEKILITTSRLVEKNGVGDVINAMPLLPENVKFRILGTGELEKKLYARVKELKLESRVEFKGFVPQERIPAELHKADIFIRPSLSEGQGISFIEAMAAGLPVVATPVGGIPDFLTDGETGVLCTPRDPQSIAEAVRRVLDDQALAWKLRTSGRKLVQERYGWDLIAKEMKSKVFEI